MLLSEYRYMTNTIKKGNLTMRIAKIMRLTGLTAALLCFAFVAFREPATEVSIKAIEFIRAPKKLSEEEVKQEISRIVREHNARNQELWKQFEQELASAGNVEFQKALEQVDPAVKNFSSLNSCRKLICKMVVDKVKKTDQTQQYIGEKLAPVLASSQAGELAMRNVYQKFLHQLQENNNQLQAQCAAVFSNASEKTKESPAMRNFEANIGKFVQQAQGMAQEAACIAIGLSIEAICWKQTYSLVTRLAGKVVTKICASSAMIGADGPLPIGDVIAIAGYGLCAYDIYKLKSVIPRRMRTTLTGSINNFQRDLRSELQTNALKALENSKESSQKIIQNV